MLSKHHINASNPNKWPRCKGIELIGDSMICELDWEHAYLLTEAAERKPHLEFLNLHTDMELANFHRAWGPLFARKSLVNMGLCWTYRRKLRAEIELVAAFRAGNRRHLSKTLLELVAAYDAHTRQPARCGGALEQFTVALMGITGSLELDISNLFFRGGSTQKLEESIPQLDMQRLSKIAEWVMGVTLSVTSRVGAVRQDGITQVGWVPSVITLAGLIHWCMWHSLVGRRALTFCKNCGDAFYPDSGHKTKFCQDVCAKRWTAREWARRKRRKDKLRTRGKHAKTKEA